MNFLYNIRKLKFIFIFLTCLFSFESNLFSQFSSSGEPYIQNIEINEPDINGRFFSLVADSSGVILAGAHHKIYVLLNGGSEIIESRGNILLGKSGTGRIYFAGNNVFGYVSFSNQKGFRLIQIPVKHGGSVIHFGQATHLVCQDSIIYLADHKHLYAIDPVRLQTQTVNTADKVMITGNPGQVWFKRDKRTYLLIENGKVCKKVNLKEKVPAEAISGIYQHGNSSFVFTENAGNYRIVDGMIYRFDAESDDFISGNRFSSITSLPDGNIAVGTYFGGVLIITDKSKPVRKIDKQGNLPDLRIYGLLMDSLKNLWINQGAGISRLQVSSAAGFFGPDQGLTGRVNSLARFDQKLWVATTTGCYYMSNIEHTAAGRNKSLSFFSKLRADCRSFFKYRNNLFIITTKGVYRLNDSGLKLLVQGSILVVAQNNKDSAIFYSAGDNGIREWKFMHDSVHLINHYTDLPPDITHMVTDRTGNLWVVTGLAEVYRLVKDATGYKNIVINYSKNKGIPPELKWIIPEFFDNNGLVMITSAGLYLYDSNRDYFSLLKIPANFRTSSNNIIYPVTEDGSASLLCMRSNPDNPDLHNGVLRAYAGKNKEGFKFYPFHAVYPFPVNTIYSDKKDEVWLGGKSGLMRFDMQQPLTCEKEYPYFRKIILNGDSLVYGLAGSATNRENPVFSYDNTLRFDFGTNDYKSDGLVMYRYFLEGYKRGWSGWSTLNFREYTFLPPGKYRFYLQVKGLCGKLSPPVTYNFSVRPPYYFNPWAFVVYFILFILLLILIIQWRHRKYIVEKIKLESIIEERTELLTLEKEKSEKLLANVLPKNTADELMMKGKASSKKYKMVTVLFSDIQGFTQIAESMNPEALIDQLDTFFFHFDSVVEKYNIEKIKTIGDAYMCAGGIPDKNRTNPVEVVLAALEVQDYMKSLKKTNKNIWDLRIGIHSGSVIAGVVGQKKLSYDIWGDTVNTASRMESSGEPGKINISEITYELVRDFFICEYRGKMPVKYKGEVDMYFVKGLRPELSVNLKSIPNKRFFIKLQLLRLADLEEFIFDKWRNEAPPGLFFHSISHTLDVYTNIELLAKAEDLGEEEMLILRTAGLFLHTGYLYSYHNSLEKSIEFALKVLPGFKYDQKQIARICSLLKSTESSLKPDNQEKRIIRDAELTYFGRIDFPEKAIALFKEMKEHNEINSFESWKKQMKKELSEHEFYTHTADLLREISKTEQLKKLRSMDS